MLIAEDISITNIVAGLVIIGVGILVADILAKLSKKVIKSFEIDRFIKRFPINDFFSSVVKFLVYIAAVVWGIFQMGIEWIVLLVVGGILLILLIWRIITGVKEVIPNYIAYKKLKIKKGRTFNAYGIKGRVREVGKLESLVKTAEGEILYVQNKLFRR
ncbi:hypothetical protein CL616_04005 [archaeon]|nr:hypothetical protein [archaeon]|tara:strand:- start:1582 stop:2058 length:477 start_codon:yes stop_codon:yes gene_type:complete